ncbi:hypothetical protein [Dyella flagellata]|uniref:hypothetical protein n=1 Tax=Dyella flagellata TaxID=1867833 RepID=UPI0024E134EC|nr:hypothetical protein [Dyella flagellata]
MTEILGYARSRGLKFSMSHGRDLVAQLLVEKSYSQAMIAKDDGKLDPVSSDEQRQVRLCAKFPMDAAEINELAAIVHHFVFWADDRLKLVMTLGRAVCEGRIDPPPSVTWATIDEFLARHQLSRADVEAVPAGPEFIHRGRHLSFVRRGQWWYLMEDFLLQDAQGLSGHLSVVVDGVMLFGRGRLPDHSALSWAFGDEHWSLSWRTHRIANDEDLDLTFDELANGS